MARITERGGLTRSKLMKIKLDSILQITQAINANAKTKDLLGIFEKILREQLSIGSMMLYHHDEGWKCIHRYGVDDSVEIDIKKEVAHIREITTHDFDSIGREHSLEIVVPVFHKNMPMAYVLIGDLSEDSIGMAPTVSHYPFIQTLANIIVVAIENKMLARQNILQAAMNRELELANEMQHMLFPEELPNDKHLEIAAYYLPHQQVGGDYYDFIRLNENEVAFCVADVSGKGVAAALLMSNFQANLRILFNHTTSLTDLVKELNAKVMANAKGEKFITLFIAKYNLVNKMMHYVNAGHNPPLVFANGSVNMLKVGCTGLGMFDELKRVKEGVMTVEGETVVLCYTDGVSELESGSGEEFGVKRIKDVLIKAHGKSMHDMNEVLLAELEKHKGSQPYIDDIALFSCRIK